ncbi:MAG: hypothetical protein Q8L48_28100 [Archangium sp.]|nr:hypothetical protein [Archangium sp.]
MLTDEAPDLSIANAADVWQQVDFGESIHVHRERGDPCVEAGVGTYDGHLTMLMRSQTGVSSASSIGRLDERLTRCAR